MARTHVSIRRGKYAADFTVEHEQEGDGRWLAEVMEVRGAAAYGSTQDEAVRKAGALAVQILSERSNNDE